MLGSFFAFATLSLFVTLLGACGGSATPAAASATSGNERESASTSDASGDSGADNEPTEEAAPKRAACDDGTCSPCGNALCPTGWYCDETAPGGPACGWLPECAQKPGCACVKKALAGCACEEQSGAAHLTCK